MACPRVPSPPNVSDHRAHLRLQSLGWALMAATFCGALSLLLPWPQDVLARMDAALRAGGCGFFYGLLAFHLQRVDPDDGHLQAGLVGAVCGVRSLAQPLPPPSPGSFAVADLLSVMMGWLAVWLPLWLPLVGSALLLLVVQRVVPSLRP